MGSQEWAELDRIWTTNLPPSLYLGLELRRGLHDLDGEAQGATPDLRLGVPVPPDVRVTYARVLISLRGGGSTTAVCLGPAKISRLFAHCRVLSHIDIISHLSPEPHPHYGISPRPTRVGSIIGPPDPPLRYGLPRTLTRAPHGGGAAPSARPWGRSSRAAGGRGGGTGQILVVRH